MRTLSNKSRLETLRKEAKRWLGELRAGDAAARARFALVHSRDPAFAGLRDVQQALAREHGLASWNELQDALADLTTTSRNLEQQVAEFIEFACLRYGMRPGSNQWDRMYNDHPTRPRHAARLLSRNPAIASVCIHTAVLSGDLAEVQRHLAQQPDCVHQKGPDGWEPLLHLCFGRLPTNAARDNAVAIARALLAAGANPQVKFGSAPGFTSLTGAIGEGEGTTFGQPPHPRARDLAALLIDHGADPYDAQALYNTSLGADDVAWLEFLYERSRALNQTPKWLHRTGEWPGTGLLDYLLGNAVGRNHLHRARWLLAHGANATTQSYYGKRPLLRDALLSGHLQMAELLIAHGAPHEALGGHDAFQAACMRLDRAAAVELSQQHPEFLLHADPMLKAAAQDRADVVALLLELGMSPDVENHSKTRALHAAASSNALRAAMLLIEHGVTIDPIDGMYHSTPLGWAHYFEKAEVRDLLASQSRDVLGLVAMGNLERLREVLSDGEPRPTLRELPLFHLPGDDDDIAAEIASALLDHGADPTVRDKDGVTAIEYNARRGLEQTAEILRGAQQRNTSGQRH
jgi:uncharacterized protein